MDWSTNPIKLRRAIDSLPKDASDEQIKDAYIKLGGSVIEVAKVNNVIEVAVEEPVKKVAKKTVKKTTKVTKKK